MIHTGCPKTNRISGNYLTIFFTFFVNPVFVFMVSGDFSEDGLDQDDVDGDAV